MNCFWGVRDNLVEVVLQMDSREVLQIPDNGKKTAVNSI